MCWNRIEKKEKKKEVICRERNSVLFVSFVFSLLFSFAETVTTVS